MTIAPPLHADRAEGEERVVEAEAKKIEKRKRFNQWFKSRLATDPEFRAKKRLEWRMLKSAQRARGVGIECDRQSWRRRKFKERYGALWLTAMLNADLKRKLTDLGRGE